ncbi:hypothetical protein C8R43DRAFT_1142317 [Mycena crocata]|nr:hypothetical protein C8R43DRAFT_1142317 [Mycena crocata]
MHAHPLAQLFHWLACLVAGALDINIVFDFTAAPECTVSSDGDGDANPEADEDQDHDGDDDDNIKGRHRNERRGGGGGPGQDKGKGKRWSPGDAEAPPLPKRQATSYGGGRALSSPPVSGSTPSSPSREELGGVAASSATSVTPWKHLGSVAESDERSKAEFDGMAVEQVDEGMEVEVGVWGMEDTEVVEDDCCEEHEDENDEDEDDDGDEDDDNDNDDVNEIQDADEKHMRERVSFFHFIMELAIENTEALTR